MRKRMSAIRIRRGPRPVARSIVRLMQTPPVIVALGPESNPVGHLVARAACSIDAAVAALERSLAEDGMLLIHRIDTQRILAAHGHAIGPARQILFFHPCYMARLLGADRAAIVEAPLKIAL